MSPITHALVSWMALEQTQTQRRDKALVVLAGLVPDIDQVRDKPRPSGRGRIARTPKASYTALMMTSIGEDGAK